MKIFNIIKQAQEMAQNMQKLRSDIQQKTVTVEVGGGAVVVVANGDNEFLSIKIRPDAIDPNDPALLEDLMLSAVNEALRKIKHLVTEELGQLTKAADFPIPPNLEE